MDYSGPKAVWLENGACVFEKDLTDDQRRQREKWKAGLGKPEPPTNFEYIGPGVPERKPEDAVKTYAELIKKLVVGTDAADPFCKSWVDHSASEFFREFQSIRKQPTILKNCKSCVDQRNSKCLRDKPTARLWFDKHCGDAHITDDPCPGWQERKESK